MRMSRLPPWPMSTTCVRTKIAYQTEQWRVARDLYRQSLEEDSEFAPAWARLGRCYRLISKYSLDEQVGRQQSALAEEAFRRALQIEPDLPSAVNLYAQLEVELGRAREALVRLIELVSKTGGDQSCSQDSSPHAGSVVF